MGSCFSLGKKEQKVKHESKHNDDDEAENNNNNNNNEVAQKTKEKKEHTKEKKEPKKASLAEEPEHFHDNDDIAAKASEMRKHANELRDEAHKPENKGDNYQKLMNQANEEDAKASRYVYEALNGKGKHPKGTIDLHLQYVKDAVRICEEQYQKLKNDVDQYIIIVGKGNHSEGGKAKIAPKIEEWAKEKGLKFTHDEGKIICELK